MRSVVSVLLVLLSLAARSQIRYEAATIPATLRPGAGAVVRNMQLSITLKDLDDVIYNFHKAVTIFNISGEEQAKIVLWYDKTREIRRIKGAIINEFGKITGTFTEKNFADRSAVNDFSLFEDTRVKVYSPIVTGYPYTIEYEYEIRSKQSLIFPDWDCNPSPGVAVERASFTVAAKPGIAIRYKQNNYTGDVVKGVDKAGMNTWHWEARNLKANKDEPLSPDPVHTLTSVQMAPEKFYYRGVTGSFSNWNEYGKWVADKLLAGRSEIPPAVADEIKAMTAKFTDPKEKARSIYAYVQKKMRYVSVQVGIGGYQPITAAETDRLSYGDCKALVNYTQGLLAVAGIKSFYTVVAAGSFKKNPSPGFATMNFGNHIILCLLFERDTTWLECTSKTLPFGFLGDFTDDRDVIACTPSGGLLLHTPRYTATQNRQERIAGFTIDDRGYLAGKMVTTFSGTQYDSREPLVDLSYPEQLKKIPAIYSLNNLDIKSFTLEQEKNTGPATIEKMEFTARDYAAVAAGKLYIPLNQLNVSAISLKEVSNRVNPVYINRGYTDTDSITYHLPAGYRVEHYPADVVIEKPFGKFSMIVEKSDSKIIYTRKIQLLEGTYPAAQYTQLTEFYRSVKDADGSKIILQKQ